VPSYVWKRKRKKKMPFRQNVVVAAAFLDFQANIFPLLFKRMDRKFFYTGVSDKAVLILYFFFGLTLFLGVMGYYIF
jgi:hypothetical protein